MSQSLTIPWVEHELGLHKDVGDLGGDHQRGPAWCRYWSRQLPDGTWQIVRLNVYATRQEKQKVYDVEVQTESGTCEDPDEFNPDIEYEYVNYTSYERRKDATRAAKRYLESISPDRDLS